MTSYDENFYFKIFWGQELQRNKNVEMMLF